MKTTALVMFSTLALACSAVAGPLRALPVNQYEVTPSPLFRDQELYFDVYGSYLQHHESACGCGGKNDGFGGGFAVGHYFAYYVGARFDVNFSSVDEAKTTIAGDILIRFPIPETHLAPYGFLGGGVEASESNNADNLLTGNHWFIRVGGGLEWRFTSHFGIFSEVSYAWLNQDSTADNLAIKLGVRYVY